MQSPLNDEILERLLQQIPRLTVAVVGDLFLDRYLDLDASLTEPSLETGLDAYQVVGVRSNPGAAGTVLNNLVALGVGRVCPVAVIGDDGEGYELLQALRRLETVDVRGVQIAAERRTPTYMKPMLCAAGKQPRELNRLDVKNRQPLAPEREEQVMTALAEAWAAADAVVVLDQVSEANCGVITQRVRERVALLAEVQPGKPVLADSRERIGLFRKVCLKPNRQECLRALPGSADVAEAAATLARNAGRPVFCTLGEEGILVTEPGTGSVMQRRIPTFPVLGPIDVVGAGDSTSAGIICALAAGANLAQAASFGNLIASITIRQLGTTGTASPEQIRQRWQEIGGQAATLPAVGESTHRKR
jgi:rfaE bifunctional protein kinase chain/domain